MRGRMMLVSAVVLVLAACNGAARKPAGEGDPRTGSSDTGVSNMNAGLHVVSTHERVPASAVAWTDQGIVTADDQGVMHWNGHDPGPVTPVDALPFASAATLIELDGRTDAATLEAAVARALAASPQAYYRVKTAAWGAGGKRLWVAVERKSPRSDRAPLTGDEPAERNVVLDDKLALAAESSDNHLAWTRIVAAGEVVATSSSHLSLWGAGEPGKPIAAWKNGPPGGMSLAGAGTLLAFTDNTGVTVVRSDGSKVAQWELAGADAVALSRDGSHLAVTVAQQLQLWRLDGDQGIKVAEVALPQLTLALAFSPDGKGIVAGGMAMTVSVLAIK